MKTNPTPAVVSTTLTPATVVPGGLTLGLDLGDRRHHVCVLDATGQILREGALPNTRPALTQLLAEFPKATADALRFYRIIRAGERCRQFGFRCQRRRNY